MDANVQIQLTENFLDMDDWLADQMNGKMDKGQMKGWHNVYSEKMNE